MLVGGLAVLVHTNGRNTRDLSFIVSLPDVTGIPGLVLENQNEWFANGSFGPLRVDFLFTSNKLFAEVAERHAGDHEFLRHRLRVASAEGLILLKLFALPSLYRQGQIQRASLYESDIASLMAANPVPDEKLLEALRPHMIESDIRALGDVLRDVRARLGRKF